MGIFHLLAIAIVAHAAYSCLRSGLIGTGYRIAGTLRPRHFLANLPVIACTAAAATAITALPGFSTGWTDLVGGSGNVMLAQTSSGSNPAVTVAIVAVITVCMPVLVLLEERAFRLGSEYRTRRQRLVRAVLFGLAHLVAGVSVGVALALTIPGLWFTNRYLTGRRDARRAHRDGGPTPLGWTVMTADDLAGYGLHEAASAHLAWNWTLVSMLAVLSLW